MIDQMETDPNQKKDLIKTRILDNNYDQGKFVMFCLGKKENGDDMANWTITELNEIISEYVNKEKDKGNMVQDSDKKSLEEKKKDDEFNKEIDQIQNVNTKVEDKKTESIEVVCRKLEMTALNNKNIVVTIKNPKTVGKGFLTSNYINYEVESSEVNFLVRRRYSDFEWLRAMLKKFNPGFMIPPLPNKKIGNRRFEDDFIEKRMKFLQKFIDAVMQYEIFKANDCLLCFLEMANRDQFESKMKELNSSQPSPYIEDFKTFNGTVTIASEEDDEKYFTNIFHFFRIQARLLERLNINMKEYHKNISHACDNLQEIQTDFEALHLINTRVLMKEQITRTFEEFSVFFMNWKRIIYKQNDLIKVHVKDFFRFINMEGTAYNELINQRKEIREKYITESTKLNSKKEKLWNQKDTTKWDIIDEFNKVDHSLLSKDKAYAMATMCTKETQFIEQIKKQLGYSNRTNVEELKKMIQTNCEKFLNNLKQFVEDYYPSLTDAINVWSGLATFLSSI